MRIILCEQAANNPDGTYSIHRGGYEHWESKEFPFTFGLTVFVEGPIAELAGGGVQEVELAATMNGTDLVRGTAMIQVLPGARAYRLPLGLQVTVQEPGDVQFTATVKSGTATETMTVRRPLAVASS